MKNHSEISQHLAKLARVINSVETLDQLTVAREYARLMYRVLRVEDESLFSHKSFNYNMALRDAMQDDLRVKGLTLER